MTVGADSVGSRPMTSFVGRSSARADRHRGCQQPGQGRTAGKRRHGISFVHGRQRSKVVKDPPARGAVERAGGAVEGNAPVGQADDPVGDRQRGVKLVQHDHDRQPALPHGGAEVAAELADQGRIDGGEWLVGEQQCRRRAPGRAPRRRAGVRRRKVCRPGHRRAPAGRRIEAPRPRAAATRVTTAAPRADGAGPQGRAARCPWPTGGRSAHGPEKPSRCAGDARAMHPVRPACPARPRAPCRCTVAPGHSECGSAWSCLRRTGQPPL